MLQRRSWVQNVVVVLMPILFCILLWVLQRVVNNALDVVDNRVGGCVLAAGCTAQKL